MSPSVTPPSACRAARSRRSSASTAAASPPSSSRSSASYLSSRAGVGPRRAGRRGAEAQPRRLCPAKRGDRLELPGPRRGCRDHGALRPYGLAAPSESEGSRGRRRRARPRRHGGVPPAPDRRVVGRAEEARLPRPRAGARGGGDPSRRALHGRRSAHGRSDHRAPQGPARRGGGDARLHPQPRRGAGLLRPVDPRQPHGSGRRAHGRRADAGHLERAFGGAMRGVLPGAVPAPPVPERAGAFA